MGGYNSDIDDALIIFQYFIVFRRFLIKFVIRMFICAFRIGRSLCGICSRQPISTFDASLLVTVQPLMSWTLIRNILSRHLAIEPSRSGTLRRANLYEHSTDTNGALRVSSITTDSLSVAAQTTPYGIQLSDNLLTFKLNRILSSRGQIYLLSCCEDEVFWINRWLVGLISVSGTLSAVPAFVFLKVTRN